MAVTVLARADSSTLPTTIQIGVVLSGGQAAGGHNVIAGLFDYVATGHPHSKLYGFIGEQSLHIRRSARSSC
jgi:hypothetical protein